MLLEIRFHGRGGQGAVTAARLLVKAGLYDNLIGQAIPFFGAERRGAPVVSYARLSDRPIKIHSQICNPDAVIVLDETLIRITNVTSGLKPNGIIIVNSPKTPQELAKTYGLKGNIATVDATGIALELNLVVAGWPVVNTSILGSISKALNIVRLESIFKAITEYWKGKLGFLNTEAAKRAYERTLFFKV